MEKRVAGIIRWLERCVKAYKNGAVESALMDAECARADIETLRDELWKKVEGSRCVQTRRFHTLRAAEAFFWAFGIMLVTATPLALTQDVPTIEGRAERNFTLEWVTPDERELLSNVRKRPSETSAFFVEPKEPIVESKAIPASVAVPVRRRTPEPQPLQTEQKELETAIPYDSILSLIEKGERAMKNEAPSIKVESAKGAAVNNE